ncbi:MAG: hypothetical protein LLG01_14835 [Planctomycetaceae bacterium]|nr:hypothetical protein [Planctomycetaceae bacterium]
MPLPPAFQTVNARMIETCHRESVGSAFQVRLKSSGRSADHGVSGKTSVLLDLAIGMEHDAVAFYTRLAANVQDKTAVEAIIREEEIHARVLTEAKARLS